MGTVLVYRNDGERPTCEVALDDGDRVQVLLDRGGVVITRQALGARPEEILFTADPDATAAMCAALLGPVSAAHTTPLDILVAAVIQIPTARQVRAAFDAAAKNL